MDNILTQNPDVWGSYVTYGTRMGTTSPLAEVDPKNTTQLLRRGSYLDAYGRGMYQSPYYTYRIRPGRNPFGNYKTRPDVASFDHETPAGSLLSLTGALETDIHAAAVFVPLSTPTSSIPRSYTGTLGYLQLDVPRSVSFSCTTAPNVDVTVKANIYGSDYYGELKMYQASFYVPADIKSASVEFGTPFFDLPTSFSQIHAVKFVSFSEEITSGAFTINTGFNFGLPYRLDQFAHILKYSETDNMLGYDANEELERPNIYIEGSYVDPVRFSSFGTPATINSWDLGVPGPIPIGLASNGDYLFFEPGVIWGNYQFDAGDIPGSSRGNNFYMATQTAYSPDNRGVIRPNLNTQSEGNTHFPGDPQPFAFDGDQFINFMAGSIMTVHYYVAGADFYQEQMKNIRKQWYTTQSGGFLNQVPINSSIFKNLGYQDYANYDDESPSTGDPTGIADPADIRALKGPRPYYELP